jgi:hypothetical protein
MAFSAIHLSFLLIICRSSQRKLLIKQWSTVNARQQAQWAVIRPSGQSSTLARRQSWFNPGQEQLLYILMCVSVFWAISTRFCAQIAPYKNLINYWRCMMFVHSLQPSSSLSQSATPSHLRDSGMHVPEVQRNSSSAQAHSQLHVEGFSLGEPYKVS